MMIFRSILAIVSGIIAAIVMILVVESIGSLINPQEGLDMNDREAMNEALRNMTAGQFLLVLLAWQAGAFVGGALSAWIAGRRQIVHAAFIGGFVFLATKATVGMYQHPDWMVWAGLLLPVPVSLLAGAIMLPRRSSASPRPLHTPGNK